MKRSLVQLKLSAAFDGGTHCGLLYKPRFIARGWRTILVHSAAVS